MNIKVSESTYFIRYRHKIEVNTDSRRRCYDGVHAKSEMRWTNWIILEIGLSENKIKNRLKFWRELNDYVVSQRGGCARSILKL